MNRSRAMTLAFAVATCSWVPHATCHYYRLETGSTFIVGSWITGEFASLAFMALYGSLAALNLWSVIAAGPRLWAASLTAAGHLTLGLLHAYRLASPFRFEVFGYPWSMGSSLRESTAELALGIACLWLVAAARKDGSSETRQPSRTRRKA